jgi:hypothetical protein
VKKEERIEEKGRTKDLGIEKGKWGNRRLSRLMFEQRKREIDNNIL